MISVKTKEKSKGTKYFVWEKKGFFSKKCIFVSYNKRAVDVFIEKINNL